MTNDPLPPYPADSGAYPPPLPHPHTDTLRILTRGWWLVMGSVILFWPLAFGAGSSFQRARFHAERGDAAEAAREYGRTKMYFGISLGVGVLLMVLLFSLGFLVDDETSTTTEYVYVR